MASDISLPTIVAVHAGSSPSIEQRAPGAESAQVAAAAPPVANPTLRLDAALGLVVIEFRNNSGAVTTSIPSERQLEAYQRWAATRVGPAPQGELRVKQHDSVAPLRHQLATGGDTKPSWSGSRVAQSNSNG